VELTMDKSVEEQCGETFANMIFLSKSIYQICIYYYLFLGSILATTLLALIK